MGKIFSKHTVISCQNYIFRYIAHYSSAETSSAVYIIGGIETPNVVAQYRDDKWHRLNDLNQARRAGHRSIVIGNEILMIGGLVDDGYPPM